MHFDRTGWKAFRLATPQAAWLLSLAALGTLIPVALADDSITDAAPLKGKVFKTDHPVRLSRPATPRLAASASESGAPFRLQGFNEMDFDKNRFLQSIKQQEGADSGELLIAWESWYKAVSGAMAANWRTHPPSCMGKAYVVIHATRDGHISVKPLSVDVDMETGDEGVPKAVLEAEFMDRVRWCVEKLSNSPALAFPEKSLRQVQDYNYCFECAAGGGGGDSYTWKKNDFERVPVR